MTGNFYILKGDNRKIIIPEVKKNKYNGGNPYSAKPISGEKFNFYSCSNMDYDLRELIKENAKFILA